MEKQIKSTNPADNIFQSFKHFLLLMRNLWAKIRYSKDFFFRPILYIIRPCHIYTGFAERFEKQDHKPG